jgi:RHS repeat-associated protein
VTISITVPAQLYFIHPDHLGTPRAITKATDNTKVWEWKNDDPFGNNQPDENPSGVAGTFKYNLRLPGQYYDVETDTLYNTNRDYDAKLGRYAQSDPLGLDGGLSTYAYVLNSPLKYVDRDGKLPELPQGFVDFSAGLGDALLLGTGKYLRDAAGVDGGVDACSDSYTYGEISSIAFGGARLAYAALAKGGAVLASTGLAASQFREGLKTVFRGGIGRNWRPPNLAGKTDAQLRTAAGKTNAAINAYGAGVATAGGIGMCGCQR